MNDKVYLHETIDIILQNRVNYMRQMAEYAPTARQEKGMVCLGIWGTVGSTERWPEVINMWELDGWEGLAGNFRHEFNHPTLQDPALAAWWAEAQKYRSGGYDRVVIPSPSSPTVEEATRDRIHGEVYYHEMIKVQPGTSRRYLDLYEAEGRKVAERFGFRLVGAYRTALVNDSEVIIVSAVPTWEDWGRFEAARESDPAFGHWSALVGDIVVDWRNKLLCASPYVPMLTGEIL